MPDKVRRDVETPTYTEYQGCNNDNVRHSLNSRELLFFLISFVPFFFRKE